MDLPEDPAVPVSTTDINPVNSDGLQKHFGKDNADIGHDQRMLDF